MRAQINQHDNELVAPQTGDGVGLAHAGLETLCNLYQQPVACIMATAIVDALEIIQIDHQHGAIEMVARAH